jgi:hypothetical protein
MILSRLLLASALIYNSFMSVAQENKKTSHARKELLKAKADSTTEVQKFIKQSLKRIDKNQQRIDELKVKKANEKRDVNAEYQERLLAIQEQNKELKYRIDNAGSVDISDWVIFKRKFKYDMKELLRIIEDND